jgi:hypothetical protein
MGGIGERQSRRRGKKDEGLGEGETWGLGDSEVRKKM